MVVVEAVEFIWQARQANQAFCVPDLGALSARLTQEVVEEEMCGRKPRQLPLQVIAARQVAPSRR